MIAFYSRQGQFIASVQDEIGGIVVTGDTDFLVQISRGNPTWQYFKTNLMAVTNDLWQSLVIPDGTLPPSTLSEAVLLSVPQPELELERINFKFKLFNGFGSVGPLLIELASEKFEAAIASDSRFVEGTPESDELDLLRAYHQQLKSDSANWNRYLGDWSDDDLTLGDHIRLEKPDWGVVFLVELGRGLWAHIEEKWTEGSPVVIAVLNFNPNASDEELADEIAGLVEGIHAGYSAAIELIVDPFNLSESYDLYDDEFEHGDEDEDDEPLWGREIYELWERYCMSVQVDTVELVAALKRRSPQFAEMARMFKRPTPDEHQRIYEAAMAFNPGFGGEMGLFDEWAGPKSERLDGAGGVSLFATHEFDGDVWAEVGCHSLVSSAGTVTTKQHVVDTFGFVDYTQLHGKFGLVGPLKTRPIVLADPEHYELAREIAIQIQYAVDTFDAIPASDVEQRANFSWNTGEVTEMLYDLGESPTKFETPRYR